MKQTYIFAGIGTDDKIHRLRVTLDVPSGTETDAGHKAAKEAMRQGQILRLRKVSLIHVEQTPEIMLVLERGEIGGLFYRGSHAEPLVNVIDLDFERDDYVKAGDRIYGRIVEKEFRRITYVHENACADRDAPSA